jgi:hypothetical protein
MEIQSTNQRGTNNYHALPLEFKWATMMRLLLFTCES